MCLVVIPARKNPNSVRQYLIDEPVLLVDAPRPAARKFVLQRLWLAYSRKRFALHVAKKTDYTDSLGPITFRPPHQVLECIGIKLNAPHNPSFKTASSSDMPSCRSRADKRRFRIVSDLSKWAVSRSEAISFHNSMGTITAVGSPASFETIWISRSGTTPAYSGRWLASLPSPAIAIRAAYHV